MPNIFEPEWDAEQDRPPFTWRRAKVAKQAGGEKLGASVFDLPPGASTFPLHFQYANEELIIVLSGRPTLRDADSERVLEPGDVVACPTGPRGAHRLDNRTEEAVRVLIVSTMIAPEVSEYPDSDKVAALSYPPGGDHAEDATAIIVRAEDEVDYLDGES
jgi:uncharacterized cupin superfamily protein